jgi:hypothetical protein
MPLGQDDSQRLLELLQNLAAGSKKGRLFQEYEQEERAVPDNDPLDERQLENEALRELQATVESPEALRLLEDFELMDEVIWCCLTKMIAILDYDTFPHSITDPNIKKLNFVFRILVTRNPCDK